jgi:hypothetical protein
MFLAVFVLQSDNKCMEICVNDDNSNYTECMNGMCD